MTKIVSLMRKIQTTQYGEKEKFFGTFEQEGKQIQADAFVGKWNSTWAVGMEIEVKADQWKQRTYQGKTYWSIGAPPEARGGFGANPQELNDIKKRLDDMQLYIDRLLPFVPMLEQLKAQAETKSMDAFLGAPADVPRVSEHGGFDPSYNEVPVAEPTPANDQPF